MDEFRNKEELERVVQEEQEVNAISQQNTIRQLEAERPNAELAMSFVSDMIKAGSAYQDQNGTL